MNSLEPANWPACWLFTNRGDVAGQGDKKKDDRVELGARTTKSKNGALTYHCTCSATFTRIPGDLVAEARSWVQIHAPHLEEPAR